MIAAEVVEMMAMLFRSPCPEVAEVAVAGGTMGVKWAFPRSSVFAPLGRAEVVRLTGVAFPLPCPNAPPLAVRMCQTQVMSFLTLQAPALPSSPSLVVYVEEPGQ